MLCVTVTPSVLQYCSESLNNCLCTLYYQYTSNEVVNYWLAMYVVGNVHKQCMIHFIMCLSSVVEKNVLQLDQ